MKNKILQLATILLFSATAATAQNNLGINTTTPDASAALAVDTASTGPQGILIPRMTQARRNAIINPAPALMIYQTDGTKGFYYNSGTAAAPVWSAIGGTTSASTGIIFEANKSGGTGETGPLAANTIPTTIVFNNAVTTPATTIGSYNATTGVYTIGADGAGTYLIQIKLLTGDATPATTTVSPFITLIKNNGTYGSTGSDVYYGEFPAGAAALPTGIRAQGSFTKLVKFAANDTFKIVIVSSSSNANTKPISAVEGSYIVVAKMN